MFIIFFSFFKAFIPDNLKELKNLYLFAAFLFYRNINKYFLHQLLF